MGTMKKVRIFLAQRPSLEREHLTKKMIALSGVSTSDNTAPKDTHIVSLPVKSLTNPRSI